MGKKGLLKKAKKLELKGIQKNKINPEHIPALEEILHDVYVICRPKPIHYHNRKDLVRIFNEIAKEIYGYSDDTPVVEEFGSFLMDIFSAKSDLDLSVNFSDKEVDFPREKKIKSLRKFGKKLYALQRRGHVCSVQQILTAKVPILKVVDRGSGIECDISVENRDGILKSQIVHMISSIDERFQMLSFLMKTWAKAHDINSSKERTLNSLSIILLVVFHLQTRDPPILPPFAEILKDGTDPAAVGKIVKEFLDYGKMNKESVAELFITLLIKLASVEKLWPKGLCASVYKGCWIFKEWDFPSKENLDSKFGCISVEDFTDRSQNVARAVGKKEVTKIYKFINHSILYVFSFMNGQIQGTKLRQVLFGRESIPAPTTNFDRGMIEPNISLDPVMTKRMRPTEEAIPFNAIPIKTVYWGGPPTEGWDGTPMESWGGKYVSIHPDKSQPKTLQYAVGWGGIQTTTTTDSIGTNGTAICRRLGR
ncbi:protein HESO1-like isoform X1 [Actinidia eriantha]|uniref:protein HESO1-like isoform X1 n=1 Tax=Actinidia eriantha TaxID=165200 RepID=UPI002590FD2D|nr:protein HESO1-like isoform X1 [Actinidia eriantha]XP_057500741.1 protein HESO1-like isoform X1 [Actinidia eriantha]